MKYGKSGSIEGSLKGSYSGDIYEINHYLYTTASSNVPDDPTFQPMFLTFIAPQNRIMQLLDELENMAPGRYQYNLTREETDAV
jgi:hypothetical protein